MLYVVVRVVVSLYICIGVKSGNRLKTAKARLCKAKYTTATLHIK